jgi:hypothetical protein
MPTFIEPDKIKTATSIGTFADVINQNINIGTQGERTITMGNLTGSLGIVLNSGSNGISLESSNLLLNNLPAMVDPLVNNKVFTIIGSEISGY